MALDRNQLKTQGLRYAKSLQMLMKTVIMFSADHKGATEPIANSYQMLNGLLKQSRTFTFVAEEVNLTRGIDRPRVRFRRIVEQCRPTHNRSGW